jgi:CubicO group peptidase (beta-lactamase class C family)
MRTFALLSILAAAFSAQAQLPASSPSRGGFDPARLETLHAITKRFVDEGQHAGAITLLARNGKQVDFQTYGYRDLERCLPIERDTICRIYSMLKIITMDPRLET